LHELVLERADGRWTVRAERAAGSPSGSEGWTLERGGRLVEAEQRGIGQLLATLELARYERLVDPEGLDPASLGLDAPAVVVRLSFGTPPKVLRLRVGGKAPRPAEARYAEVLRPGGERAVYAVSEQLVEAIQTVPLRSKRLVPHLGAELAELALFDGDEEKPRWRLVRQRWPAPDRGAFALAQPDGAKVRADHRAVGALLVALELLEASSWLDPADAEAAAKTDSRLGLAIERRSTKPRSLRLDLGGPCPGGPGLRVVQRGARPAAACVRGGALQALDVQASALVDRHALGAARSHVIELKLAEAASGGGAKESATVLEIARREAGWHVRAPAGQSLDDQALERWVEELAELRGTVVPAAELGPLADYGLDPVRARLRIVSLGAASSGAQGDAQAPGDERLEHLELGSVRDGVLHVRREEDGAVLRLSAEADSVLRPEPATLRSAAVYDVPARAFRSLRLRCDGVEQRYSRSADRAWTLSHPRGLGLGADSELVSSLAARLGALRALRWVGREPPEDHGLSEPWCTIEAELGPSSTEPARGGAASAEPEPTRGTGRQLRVVLGAMTRGGYYARRDQDEEVFVAPRALGDDARHWLLDRSAAVVDAEAAERVLIRGREGRRLELVRQGQEWSEPATAQRLCQALGALMAEGIASVGPPTAHQGLARPLLRIVVEPAPESGEPVTLTVGAGDVWRNSRVFYLRRQGVDATFAVARSRLGPLLEAW